MPVPFGFSVGDVIAGIGVLHTAYNATKDLGGASNKYQQHIIWLNHLIEVLEKLRLETDDTVPPLAEDCKAILVAFKDTIEAKYQTHLGADGKKGKWHARKFRQLQWAFLKDAEKDLVRLRSDVQPQLTAIGLHLDVQLKSAVENVQTTSNATLTAVGTLSDIVDRGFHDDRHALKALPGQLAAQSVNLQHSIATSATILTETRNIVEETRDTLVQIKSTAPYLLKHNQYGDVAGLPPFVLACMKRAMKEVLKEHQEQLSDQGETSGTSNPTMRANFALSDVHLQAHIPPVLPVSQTISDFTTLSTLSTTSKPVKSMEELGTFIEDERAKTCFSARQLNLWFGTLFTWTRTDIVDDDKPIYSSVIRITKTTYYFWPAKWFSRTGAFLISEIVYKAFRKPEVKYLWETYRVVPEDSPIIQACVDLDLPQIQYLFNERLASPFDRDECGSSLFDYCAAVLRHPLSRSEIARITTKLIEIAEYLILCGADLDPFDELEVQSFLAASKTDWTKHRIAELSSYTLKGSFAYIEVYSPAPSTLGSRSGVIDPQQREPDFVDVQDIDEMIKTMSDLYELRKALTFSSSKCDKVKWLVDLMQGQKIWTQEGMLLATQLVENHGFSDLWSEILSNSRITREEQVYKQWNGVQYIKLPEGDPYKLKRLPERRRNWFGYGTRPVLQLPGANPFEHRLWLQHCCDHQL